MNVLGNGVVIDPESLWKEYMSGLWQRLLLQDVDITKPPYITEYPELKGFMDIQPREIRQNVSENNVLIGCKSVLKGDWATNETTVVFETDPGMDEIRRRLPAFKPIPLGQIGARWPKVEPVYDGPRAAAASTARLGIGNVMEKIRSGKEVSLACIGVSGTVADDLRRLLVNARGRRSA